MRSVSGRQNDIAKQLAEPLVNGECDYLEWWYVHVPALTARSGGDSGLAGGRRESVGGRSSLTRPGMPGRERRAHGRVFTRLPSHWLQC